MNNIVQYITIFDVILYVLYNTYNIDAIMYNVDYNELQLLYNR